MLEEQTLNSMKILCFSQVSCFFHPYKYHVSKGDNWWFFCTLIELFLDSNVSSYIFMIFALTFFMIFVLLIIKLYNLTQIIF